MDWTERINGAIGYIEDNLGGTIENERLAQLAGCSLYNFQRMFAYIADKPLSQYIRERRLTLAAFDIVRTRARLIDVALCYGYESQDAFSRAFRQYHGVLPSVVRREAVTLQSCPRLIFHKMVEEATPVKYRIEQWPAFTVAGFRTRMTADDAFAVVPTLWKDIWTNGRIERIQALFEQADYRPEGYLGVAVGGQHGTGDVDYYQGVTTWVDSQGVRRVGTPEGMEALEIPAATWVIIEANGAPTEAIQPVYRQFYREWLPHSGYGLADLPVIESYLLDNQQNVWFAVEKE